MGDRAFLKEQVDLFKTRIPAELEALRSEAANADPDGLARRAHSLKGAAASLSIDGISALALELETRGRTRNLIDLESIFSRLEDEAAQFERFAADRVAQMGEK